MKAKKVLTSMLFACVACLACFSFVACAEPALSNVHTHDYTWTVTKEATCESDGSRHGVCACGVETDEVLPKLDHDYGDWVASKRPTPTENGTAKRVCKANPAHVEEKSLPKATVDSYEISTDDNGLVLDYVYKDDPDITFKAYDVSTVAKAVQVAALTDPLAVGGTINVKSETLAGRNDKNAALPTDQAATEFFGSEYVRGISNATVKYELTGNYAHYDDGLDLTEKWYTLNPDNSIFPVIRRSTSVHEEVIAKDEGATLDDFRGYGLGFTYAQAGLSKSHGAGEFLKALYTMGANNPNGDWTETKVENEGITYYTFHFGFKDPDVNNAIFFIVDVSFALDEDYVVVDATASAKAYVGTILYTYVDNKLLTIANPEAEPSKQNIAVVAGAEGYYKNKETFEIKQYRTHKDGKVPTNPYRYEDMLASSFSIKQEGVRILDDSVIELNPGKAITLTVDEILPTTTNFYFDDIKILLRTEDGDIELQPHYDGGEDGNIKAYYNKDLFSITLTPYIAGEHTIVIKTTNVEHRVILDTPWINPTDFGQNIYVYKEIAGTGFWDKDVNDVNLYTGEPLDFASSVGHPAYEDAGYTATVEKGGTDVTASVLAEGEVDGKPTSRFVAAEAGTYTVTLTSVRSGIGSASFKVYVAPAKSVAQILNGGYNNADETLKFEFTPSAEGATEGNLQITRNTTATPVTAEYTYAYENGAITTTHVSGDRSWSYDFEITPACNIKLTYTDEFDATDKKVTVLRTELYSALNGSYSFTNTKETGVQFVADYSGAYRLTAERYSYTAFGMTVTPFYNINNASGNTPYSGPVTLNLHKGDTFATWMLFLQPGDTIRYTIECIGKSVDVASVKFAEKTMEMFIGEQNVTNPVTVNPDNATNPAVTYSTSDAEILYVDTDGMFVARKAGTVTVTVMAVENSALADECTVTVKDVETTAISFASSAMTLEGSETRSLSFTCTPANATDHYKAVWTVEDEGVVRLVDFNTGKTAHLKPINAGTTTVTVTLGTLTAEIEVTVTKVAVTNVAFAAETLTMALHSSKSFAAVVTPSNASDTSVIYASSDADTVSVTDAGILTAHKTGTATITATSVDDPTKSATCTVTVSEPATTAAQTQGWNSLSIGLGNVKFLEFTGEASKPYELVLSGSNNYVKFSAYSDNTFVTCTVEPAVNTIVFHTDAQGKAYILVASDVIYAETSIMFRFGGAWLQELSTWPGSAKINVGETTAISVSPYPENAIYDGLTYTSSDTNIATVDDKGVVTAVAPGTATITIATKDGTISTTFTVTVAAPLVALNPGDSTTVTPEWDNDLFLYTAQIKVNVVEGKSYTIAVASGSSKIRGYVINGNRTDADGNSAWPTSMTFTAPSSGEITVKVIIVGWEDTPLTFTEA